MLQYFQCPAPVLHAQLGGETGVAIVKEKLIVAVARDRFPQLLERPFRRWMFCHIAMDDLSGPDLDGDEYMKHTEGATLFA